MLKLSKIIIAIGIHGLMISNSFANDTAKVPDPFLDALKKAKQNIIDNNSKLFDRFLSSNFLYLNGSPLLVVDPFSYTFLLSNKNLAAYENKSTLKKLGFPEEINFEGKYIEFLISKLNSNIPVFKASNKVEITNFNRDYASIVKRMTIIDKSCLNLNNFAASLEGIDIGTLELNPNYQVFLDRVNRVRFEFCKSNYNALTKLTDKRNKNIKNRLSQALINYQIFDTQYDLFNKEYYKILKNSYHN